MRQGIFQCWQTADNWLKLLDKVLLGVGLGSLFQDSNVYFSLQVFDSRYLYFTLLIILKLVTYTLQLTALKLVDCQD